VANYSIVLKSSAQKELDALDEAVFRRIDRKILALAEDPRPARCKKLKGYKDQWRIRIGD
jgi:mRNA interferase RelE/StbE